MATKKTSNRNLHRANQGKKDEFYTQLPDIENELKYYKEKFRGKVVFLNCDDPYESNFFKYFASNFNYLGLRKLIATSYAGSPIIGAQLPLPSMAGMKGEKEPIKIEINEVPDSDGDGAIDLSDVRHLLEHNKNIAAPISGNGDFRSDECVALLKQADIICTNPPFSLFRDFVAQLVEYKKKFLIIGNVNAITYEEIFPLIKENRIWLGASIHSGDREFRVPNHYPLEAAGFRVDENGVKYIRVKGVRWFTNLDYDERHEKLELYKKYNPEDYPSYDNYSAIEVSKTADIPMDYDGAMGVPITFLDKYNPDQFLILGLTDRKNTSGLRIKQYTAKDTPLYNDLNRRGAIKTPEGYKSTYARILIKKKII